MCLTGQPFRHMYISRDINPFSVFGFDRWFHVSCTCLKTQTISRSVDCSDNICFLTVRMVHQERVRCREREASFSPLPGTLLQLLRSLFKDMKIKVNIICIEIRFSFRNIYLNHKSMGLQRERKRERERERERKKERERKRETINMNQIKDKRVSSV